MILGQFKGPSHFKALKFSVSVFETKKSAFCFDRAHGSKIPVARRPLAELLLYSDRGIHLQNLHRISVKGHWACTNKPPVASTFVLTGAVWRGKIVVQYRNLVAICPLSLHKQRWQRAYRYMGREAAPCYWLFGSARHIKREAKFLSLNPVFCDWKKRVRVL